jgi:hypothetical protein
MADVLGISAPRILFSAEDFDIFEDPIERTPIVRPFPPEFHAAYSKPQL